MEIYSPLDIDHIESSCSVHGDYVTTGEVEGMVLYFSCPVSGCSEGEDTIDMEAGS